MQTKKRLTVALLTWLSFCSFCHADCPLDHLFIGCNADGIVGTEDDNKLFVDCTQKYRHSDPNHPSDPTWLNWHYPLYYNLRYDRYQIGEPGFDVIEADDPNRQLQGTPDTDYQIIVECISITPGFIAKSTDFDIELNEAGDWFNHSALSDSHLHLEYRAPAPSGETNLQWIMFVIYDNFENYQPSEPFGLVFVKDPLAGDLVVDGIVDVNDLAEFCYYWLEDNADRSNDYYERADANKDGTVNFLDFALFAQNWLWENIPADIDMDGDVDFVDYAILGSRWRYVDCNEPDWCSGADLDKSGSVDLYDLAEFADHWLEGTSP